MRAKYIPAQEQYRLVMECRTSGLTDRQWCKEQGIKPGTFYNWVRRLRQKGTSDIPEAAGARTSVQQEVVRIDFPNLPVESPSSLSQDNVRIHDIALSASVMELSIAGATLRVPNGTDPRLLGAAVRSLAALPC